MPVEFKDYYAVLGIARTASDDEIKKAFRKLARQYHPDVAKDKKTAESKFKEINEAHEVLSDPGKRRKYDELGADWQNGGRSTSAPGEGPGGWSRSNGAGGEEYHFGGTGFSDFFEQFFGGAQTDRGDFQEVFRNARQRNTESGRAPPERGSDVEGDILVTLAEALAGSTRSLSLQRLDPHTGEGETETFKVRIPPGAQQARRIRVPGKGGPGRGGAEPGDLFLRVRLEAHPDFEVKGDNLYHACELAPWELVLGAQVVVPTLSGSVKVRIPPGSNHGRQFRVRGQGLPKGATGERGDLYVVISVQLPGEVTPEERELWEKLARISKFNPRRNES